MTKRKPLADEEPEEDLSHEPEDPPEPEAVQPETPYQHLGADHGSESVEADKPTEEGMETVVHEQRARSAEIEAMGVEKWKEAHDERKAGEGGKQVPGVTRPKT